MQQSLDQFVTNYKNFHSSNGAFVGGGPIDDLFDLGGLTINQLSDFVSTNLKFLSLSFASFKKYMDGVTDELKRAISFKSVMGSANYNNISESKMMGMYGAYQAALESEYPAFTGGACDCESNVMDFWNHSSYLVFHGGVETTKNVTLLYAGVNLLIDLIQKSMKNKASELHSPEVQDLVKTYMEALTQLKGAIGTIQSELIKQNANMKKDFDTYANYSPDKILETFQKKVNDKAIRAEFLDSIKLLGPTTYYAVELKNALSKFGLAVADFKAANTDQKFNALMNKLTLELHGNNVADKQKALEIIRKLHLERASIQGSDEQYEQVIEEDVRQPDEFLGGKKQKKSKSGLYTTVSFNTGESIFGGDVLALDKNVTAMLETGKLYQTPLEIAFTDANADMMSGLLRTAMAASTELYKKRDLSDDNEILLFLTKLDTLRVANMEAKAFKDMFFQDPAIFGLNYARDAYIANLSYLISAAKAIEPKIGSEFGKFVRQLEAYRTFLDDTAKKTSSIVSKFSENSKFLGGVHESWGFTFNDVIDRFTRGILVSKMQNGLNLSITELESYNNDQDKMISQIVGKEINEIMKYSSDIINNYDDKPANFPIKKDFAKVVLLNNIDGFVQLQRASQALDERMRVYQLHIIKNPNKVKEIVELLSKVSIDINSIGDETFENLGKFLDHFQVESVAKNGTTYDAAAFAANGTLNDDTVNPPGAVANTEHNTRTLYDNSYLKEDGLTPFPIKYQSCYYSHVPTLILATLNGKIAKKNSIPEHCVNTYHGKRVFPAKTSNVFDVLRTTVVPATKDGSAQCSNVVLAGLGAPAVAGTTQLNLTNNINCGSYLPMRINFLSAADQRIMYTSAMDELVKGVRQITSLKNLFSIFSSIDKAYEHETGEKKKFGMKIGEIYECMVNYIVNTTMYPVFHKTGTGADAKYMASHIALRKFGYDIISPMDSDTGAKSRNNELLNALEVLSLKEYASGPDYGLHAAKWINTNNPFPGPGETVSTRFEPDRADKPDYKFYSTTNNFRDLFSKHDTLVVFMQKAIYSKIFSVLSLFNVLNMKDITHNLPFHQLRAIYGGTFDGAFILNPTVKPEYTELYIRVYLYGLFYKSLFFEEAIGENLQHIVAGARRMVVLPGGNQKFSPLFELMFLRNFDKMLGTESGAYHPRAPAAMHNPGGIKTGDSSTFSEFINICNKIGDEYKETNMSARTMKVINDLVQEVNRRYGVVSTDNIKKLMQDTKQKKYPGMVGVSSIGLNANANPDVKRVPPTLLDGEGADFRSDTHVPSDKTQFGDTTVGRVLTLINPADNAFNYGEIIGVIYNFRKKLDEMTKILSADFDIRYNNTGVAPSDRTYANVGLISKIMAIQRQLSTITDNRGRYDAFRNYLNDLGNITIYSISKEVLLYRELVYTPCSLLNKLYNRIIGITNLCGKQSENNALNRNTHLFDLDSVNTDLVGTVDSVTGPKLDFSNLNGVCQSFLEQTINFHRTYRSNLRDTDKIARLDRTIDSLVNQHNYVFFKDGPLADENMEYDHTLYNPMVDYSEFPNVVYNAGSDILVGTNSWYAYRGTDVYQNPVSIEDPRHKKVEPGKAGPRIPQLDFNLLSRSFSPKNPYQLFEYLLICMYRVFYEKFGTVYSKLFMDFVDKLGSFMNFNIDMNNVTAELGGVEAFQKDMPFSNKIGVVYRTMYRYSIKTNVPMIQPDITLLPNEYLELMRKYIPLFLFLLKYIVKQAHTHMKLISKGKYVGNAADPKCSTDEVMPAMHDLAVPGGRLGVAVAAADPALIAAAMQTLYGHGSRPGMSMYGAAEILGGIEFNDQYFADEASIKKTLRSLEDYETKLFDNSKAFIAAQSTNDLSFNSNFDAALARVYINKINPRIGSRLITANDLVVPSKFDFALIKSDPDNLVTKIKDKYKDGINLDAFKLVVGPLNFGLNDAGHSHHAICRKFIDSKLIGKLKAPLMKLFNELIISEPSIFSNVAQTIDVKLQSFFNMAPFDRRSASLLAPANISNMFGFNTGTIPSHVVYPCILVGSNQFINFTSQPAFDAAFANLVAAPAANAIFHGQFRADQYPFGLHGVASIENRINPILTSLRGIGAGKIVNANDIVLFSDPHGKTPLSHVGAVHGTAAYIKLPVANAITTDLYAIRCNDNNANNSLLAKITTSVTHITTAINRVPHTFKAAAVAGAGANALKLGGIDDASFTDVIRFIDNIDISYFDFEQVDKNIHALYNTNKYMIGMIPSAVNSYVKHHRLTNDLPDFDKFLHKYIEEKIELIFTKDHESFIKLVFGLLLKYGFNHTGSNTLGTSNWAAVGTGVGNAGNLAGGAMGAAVANDSASCVISFGQAAEDDIAFPTAVTRRFAAGKGSAVIGLKPSYKEDSYYDFNKLTYCDPHSYFGFLLSSAITVGALKPKAVYGGYAIGDANSLGVGNAITNQFYSTIPDGNKEYSTRMLGNGPVAGRFTYDKSGKTIDKCAHLPKYGITQPAQLPDGHSYKHSYKCSIPSIFYEDLLRVINCYSSGTFADRYNKFKDVCLNTFKQYYATNYKPLTVFPLMTGIPTSKLPPVAAVAANGLYGDACINSIKAMASIDGYGALKLLNNLHIEAGLATAEYNQADLFAANAVASSALDNHNASCKTDTIYNNTLSTIGGTITTAIHGETLDIPRGINPMAQLIDKSSEQYIRGQTFFRLMTIYDANMRAYVIHFNATTGNDGGGPNILFCNIDAALQQLGSLTFDNFQNLAYNILIYFQYLHIFGALTRHNVLVNMTDAEIRACIARRMYFSNAIVALIDEINKPNVNGVAAFYDVTPAASMDQGYLPIPAVPNATAIAKTPLNSILLYDSIYQRTYAKILAITTRLAASTPLTITADWGFPADMTNDYNALVRLFGSNLSNAHVAGHLYPSGIYNDLGGAAGVVANTYIGCDINLGIIPARIDDNLGARVITGSQHRTMVQLFLIAPVAAMSALWTVTHPLLAEITAQHVALLADLNARLGHGPLVVNNLPIQHEVLVDSRFTSKVDIFKQNSLRTLKFEKSIATSATVIPGDSKVLSTLGNIFLEHFLHAPYANNTVEAYQIANDIFSSNFLGRLLIIAAFSLFYNPQSYNSLIDYIGFADPMDHAAVAPGVAATDYLRTSFTNAVIPGIANATTQMNLIFAEFLKNLPKAELLLLFTPKKQVSTLYSKPDNTTEYTSFITDLPTIIPTDIPAGVIAGRAGAKEINITAYNEPVFVDENYITRQCAMNDLVMPGVDKENYISRAKNAIIFASTLFKSLSGVYAEIGDAPKYLETDSYISDLNQILKKEEKIAPLSFAVDLIPNIVNSYTLSGGVHTEANCQKSYTSDYIERRYPLGLHCNNIHDLDQLFGNKSQLYNLVRIFLLSDSQHPLTLRDFPWVKALTDEAAVSATEVNIFVQQYGKLIKYLYELEFKSMFGNMFPVFNNLDMPKFNFRAAVGATNSLDLNFSIRTYGLNLRPSSLATSLGGVLGYRKQSKEALDIIPPQKMIELATGRVNSAVVADGQSAEITGFSDREMLQSDEFVALLEIDNNDSRLSKALSIDTLLSTEVVKYGNNALNAYIAENILDGEAFPINIHAMNREIPMANIINNNYSFDQIMKWLLKPNSMRLNVLDIVNGDNAARIALAPAARVRGILGATIAGANRNIPGGYDGAGELFANPGPALDDFKNNLFNNHLHAYAINPMQSYVVPFKFEKKNIIATNGIYYTPSQENASKLDVNTISRLESAVEIMSLSTSAGPAGANTNLAVVAAGGTIYDVSRTQAVDYIYDVAIDVTADTNDTITNHGVHTINNGFTLHVPTSMFPLQVNPVAANKFEESLTAVSQHYRGKAMNLSLGIHLTDLEGSIGKTKIKKSKLVQKLVGNPPKFAEPAIGALDYINYAKANIAPCGANNIDNYNGVDVAPPTNNSLVDPTSYYGKQADKAQLTGSDLMHGVDRECQIPVLAINTYSDVLFNIYTAKLFDEIKATRKDSSQISIGQMSVLESYNDF